MFQPESFLPYLAIQIFGTVMQAVTASEWITLKWKSANITNHDLQRALRASYEDALNSINFAFRQKAGLLDKFGKNRLHKEVTITFNEQFLNPFISEKKLSPEELRSLALNCSDYCRLLRSAVDTVLPLAEVSEVNIEDLLLTGRNLKGADDVYRLNSRAIEELMEKVRRIDSIPNLFCELLAYKGLLLGSIVFFFNERIKSDERVRSILMHSELQRIREEQSRQHHQQVAILEEALQSKSNSFTTSLSPIRDNFSEVLNSLERVEVELAQNTKYLERIYDMLCQDRGLSDKERRQLQAGLSTTFSLHDKYEFDESSPIGYGSVAVVYKVVHKGIQQVRALKLLKPEHKNNPEVVERFLREAIALGSLTHPNIVRIYDAGGGGPDLKFYLEMEYIEGTTLRDWIRAKPFNWDATLKLITQLCSTIQKIHEAGIIHRDLNPRNIMVDRGNNLKVMDFGVAKIIGLEGLTRAGQVVGTHDYIAPEQARGERVDERADIYSFGVIVYELCTKRIPSIPLVTFKQYQSKVPQWLENVVVKCLELERNLRYSSMRDIISDIEVNTRCTFVAETIPTSNKYPKEKTSTEQSTKTTVVEPDRKSIITRKPLKNRLILPLISLIAILASVIGVILLINKTDNFDANKASSENSSSNVNSYREKSSENKSITEVNKLPELSDRIPVWQFDYRDDYVYSDTPIVDDTRVFFVAEGIIYCLDAFKGTLICKYNAPVNTNPYSLSNKYSYHLIGVYQNSLIVANNSDIYCVGSEKGNTLWYLLGGSDYVLNDDKLYFYENKFSIEDLRNNRNYGVIRCVDVVTGRDVWEKSVWDQFSELGKDAGVVQLLVYDNRILIMYCDEFYKTSIVGTACLDKNTGQLLYKNSSNFTDVNASLCSMVVATDKIIEAIRFDSGNQEQVIFICLDINTNKELWRTEKYDWQPDSMAMHNDKLVVCHQEGIVCFDANSGHIIWQYQKSGIGVFIVNDIALVSIVDGTKVCNFDLNSGEIVKQYRPILFKAVIKNNIIFNNDSKSILCYTLY